MKIMVLYGFAILCFIFCGCRKDVYEKWRKEGDRFYVLERPNHEGEYDEAIESMIKRSYLLNMSQAITVRIYSQTNVFFTNASIITLRSINILPAVSYSFVINNATQLFAPRRIWSSINRAQFDIDAFNNFALAYEFFLDESSIKEYVSSIEYIFFKNILLKNNQDFSNKVLDNKEMPKINKALYASYFNENSIVDSLDYNERENVWRYVYTSVPESYYGTLFSNVIELCSNGQIRSFDYFVQDLSL